MKRSELNDTILYSVIGGFAAGYVAGILKVKLPEAPKQEERKIFLENTSFGVALAHLERGKAITRKGWNGKGMYLKLQKPDEKSKMTQPYIYMTTADDNLVPWLASQTDMLAHDWVVFYD